MLRLPKLTDYAVVILAALAREPGLVQATTGLAAQVNLPEPTVSKILKKLTRSGILTAQRGVHGGYRLAQPAAQITVAAIVAAMDGPVALTSCVDGQSGHCGVESVCAMRGHWNTINRAIQVALESVSLADMSQTLLMDRPPLERPDTHSMPL